MKKIVLSLIIIFPLLASAQDEPTMRFLPQLAESGWSTASNRTDTKISIGLPVLSSTSVHLFSNGFTYHNLFNIVGDTTFLQLGNVINHLKANNFVGFGTSISLFHINYTTTKFSIGLFINSRIISQFNYPGDLFKLLWNGNGGSLGQTLQIGNFGVNAMIYNEYGLHFSTKFKRKWTFGVNPKILFGKFDMYTKTSSLTLYTDPNYYQMTAAANLNFQTSGIPDSNQRKNIDAAYVKNYTLNTANKGFAIDLSAKYDFNEKLSMSVGVNDLGAIHWASNLHNYTSNVSALTFDGIHAENIFQGDSSSNISFQKYTDSLKKKFQIQNNQNAYTTRIPLNLYAMALYQLNTKNKVGAQFNSYYFAQNYTNALTLFYQFRWTKHFSIAATYTAKSRSAFNVGGGLVLQFLNMQWYMTTDNWWAAIKPLDSKNVNLRFGMNVVWGDANKKEEPQPIMENLKEQKK